VEEEVSILVVVVVVEIWKVVVVILGALHLILPVGEQVLVALVVLLVDQVQLVKWVQSM